MLTCTVLGSPRPVISWYRRREGKRNLTLYSDNRTSIVTTYNSAELTTTSVLTITGVLSTDEGDYVCEANNSLSTENLVSILTINIPGKKEYNLHV